MSLASQKLKEVSQKDLEMAQGKDEIYRSVIKTRNFLTKVLGPYDLSTVTEMTMIIENKPEAVVYFTGLMTGGTPNVIREDSSNGLYRVEVPKAITEVIPVGNWNYHIFVTTSSGLERLAVIGKMKVFDD